MRAFIVIAALLSSSWRSQVHSTVPAWSRAYVQSSLHWEGPSTASPEIQNTAAIVLYFFGDHRYMAVKVVLMKGTAHHKTPGIIESEGYVVRAG
jgi:hypothetical protein